MIVFDFGEGENRHRQRAARVHMWKQQTVLCLPWPIYVQELAAAAVGAADNAFVSSRVPKCDQCVH